MNTKGVEDGMTDEQLVKQFYPWAQKAICVWDGVPLTSETHLGCDWADAAAKIRAKLPKLEPKGDDCAELDTIPVHIKRRDWQAAKAYVEGYNSGLETAAYVLESGHFLSNESLEYKWAHQVAGLVRSRKTAEVPELETEPSAPVESPTTPHRVGIALRRIMNRIGAIKNGGSFDVRDEQFIENELLDVWDRHSILPAQPSDSPTFAYSLAMRDEVAKLVNEVRKPGECIADAAVTQLWPLLVELVERRKRDAK
jgi:hypothetical protein